MITKFDVQAALSEVQSKSEADIEKETAVKWGARAVACYLLAKQTGKLSWLFLAEHYRDEAFEHAALVKDSGSTLAAIQTEVDAYRTRST